MRLLKKIDDDIARSLREKEDAARIAYTQEALGDLAGTRARCESLHGFVMEAWKILEPASVLKDGWAIKAICDHLEAVTYGHIQYLLINVPPGMMKSLLVSVFWPAWEWGPAGRSTLRYLSSSYSRSNIIRDNTKMRSLVESEWFQALWPEVKPTPKWGELKFANVRKGERDGRPWRSLTGGRGDRVIGDDPHSTETAESNAERERAIRIFRESLSDRLNDVNLSAVVIIMQRLHEGDVSGVILKLNPTLPPEKRWVHLCLPMEFDPDTRCSTYLPDGTLFFTDPRIMPGELLFPERFDATSMQAMKTVKGTYAWAGQYQQTPSPRDGSLFNVDAIRRIKALPAGARKTVRAWDFAASIAKQGSDPDWTVGVKMSVDDAGFIYVEDVKRFRARGADVKAVVRRTAEEDGGEVQIRYPQDPGAAGKSLAEDYARLLSGFMFTFGPVTGSKETRATPLSSQADAGNVFVLEAAWTQDFLDELRAFPTGKHDDQVDAAADAYNKLAGVVPGEGLYNFMRQEAAKVEAKLRGEQTAVAATDWVTIKGPPTIGMLSGATGVTYDRDPQTGTFTVHPSDAPGFLRGMGWVIVAPPPT